MKAPDLFQAITDQLIADIEAGAGQWHMPWLTLADAGTPHSVDGRRYRGANALWLVMVGTARDWPSGTWATYRAWQRHGAQVRRGEQATSVLLWKQTRPRSGRDTSTDGSDDTPPGTRRKGLFVVTFNVFAAEQVDGTDDLLAQRTAALLARDAPERIAAADAYFTGLPLTVVEGGNQACYIPHTDTIRVPAIERFDHAAHYYGTRAHESVHATGHPHRLARDFAGRFGTDAYAAEELVAELGAAMWCAQAGLSATTRPDHAAYLAGWLSILRADPRSLITVASKAQTAIDWLNTHTTHPLPDTTPSLPT